MSEILTPNRRIIGLSEIEIIQGGMGVGASNWWLASKVAATGEMGVVSSVAIGLILARRLQNGDPGGFMLRALSAFPDQDVAQMIIRKYYLQNGRQPDHPYKGVPMLDARQDTLAVKLNMAGAFAEVWLAKQLALEKNDQPGPIGINLLTKIQASIPSALYGAMLAGVDCVLMGAGLPYDIPKALDDLANNIPSTTQFDVTGSKLDNSIIFDPAEYLSSPNNELEKPIFLAIIAASSLAQRLAKSRDLLLPPDGFIIEGHTAGGHNAPPRDKKTHQYGPKDDVELEKIVELGLPFWLAGGYGTPEGLTKAIEKGANGIQVGSLFALCNESGLDSTLRQQTIDQILKDKLVIYTDMTVSPTGYPFGVALQKEATATIYETGTTCKLGFLREAYVTKKEGEVETIDYRCPAELVNDYIKKGGNTQDTLGKICLCSALCATIGLSDNPEHIITLGKRTPETVRCLIGKYGLKNYSAVNVIDFLRGGNR